MRLYFDFRAAKQPYGAEALGLMSYRCASSRSCSPSPSNSG